jgi:hypothetical protein
MAVDEHPSLGGVVEAGDELRERRLAGARGADERQRLARGDREVDVLERSDFAGGPVARAALTPAAAAANETSSKRTSPRMRSSRAARGRSVREGRTSSSWKIFSSAAMPDW